MARSRKGSRRRREPAPRPGEPRVRVTVAAAEAAPDDEVRLREALDFLAKASVHERDGKRQP